MSMGSFYVYSPIDNYTLLYIHTESLVSIVLDALMPDPYHFADGEPMKHSLLRVPRGRYPSPW